MKLNSKNLRLMLMGGLALSIAAFFCSLFFGLSALASKSQAMTGLKVKSQTANTQLANLEQAKKAVEKYAYFKSVATTVIPNDKNQAEAIVEINNIANEAGIAIQSITFPASTLGLSLTTPQDATSSSAQNAISQAIPVSGVAGLYSLELTVTPMSNATLPLAQQATYAKMLDFLNRIENNRHTAQITQVKISPTGGTSVGASGFSFSLVINIFIKP